MQLGGWCDLVLGLYIQIYMYTLFFFSPYFICTMSCACPDDFPTLMYAASKFDGAIFHINLLIHCIQNVYLTLSFTCIHGILFLALLHRLWRLKNERNFVHCIVLRYAMLEWMDLRFMLLPSIHCTKFKRAPCINRKCIAHRIYFDIMLIHTEFSISVHQSLQMY